MSRSFPKNEVIIAYTDDEYEIPIGLFLSPSECDKSFHLPANTTSCLLDKNKRYGERSFKGGPFRVKRIAFTVEEMEDIRLSAVG